MSPSSSNYGDEMPPFKVSARCCDCNWERTGWHLSIGSLVDRHHKTSGHEIIVYRQGLPIEHIASTKPVR